MRLRLPFLAILILAMPLRLVAQQADYPPPDQVRASFRKLLDRPKVPADPKVESTTPQKDGWVLEHLTFASERKADGAVERVPTIVLRPAEVKTAMPAVIVLHGTGGNM